MGLRSKGISGIADLSALEAAPLEAQMVHQTTYDVLRAGTTIAPNAPAITFLMDGLRPDATHVTSHADLIDDVHRCANVFRRLGVGREDVVAFILPNLPETFSVIWGGQAAGIILAINPMIDAKQMGQLMQAARAKVLVTLEPTPKSDIWEKAADAVGQVDTLKAVLFAGVGQYLKGATGVAYRGFKALKRPRIDGVSIPVLSLRKEMAGANSEALDFAPPHSNDVSSMFCTGGTTGLPKIAKRTHMNEAFNTWAMRFFAPDLCASGETFLCGLPLFHTNAKLISGLMPIGFGGHVLLTTPSGFRGEGVIPNFWKLVDRYKVAAFSGVPTVYTALLDQPKEGYDLSSLRVGFCGAAPMPVGIFTKFEAETGLQIMEGYGLTEGTVVSAINPLERDQPRIGSIGIRIPYQDMCIGVFDESGAFLRKAETGEIGTILISGPNVFAGYIDDRHDEGIWVEAEGKTWFITGDLAKQDAEGYFWMTGRKKELIIRGGHNIDPKIIEEPLHQIDDVVLAAAVGRPDLHAGEVPVAYIQKKPGSDLSYPELAEFCETAITERAARPKAFVFIDEMPLTTVGKIFKPDLKMREIEYVVRREAEQSGFGLQELSVIQDPKEGIVAHVQAAKQEALLKHLSAFTFKSTEASDSHR